MEKLCIKMSKNSKTVMLFFVMLLFSVNNIYGYSGYVGEIITIPAPNVEGVFLDAAAWAPDDKNKLWVKGDTNGAQVRILKYFEGSETITCFYAYTYYWFGELKHGHGNFDIHIQCKPSTVRLDKTELVLKPGEKGTLTYTNSSGYTIPSSWTSSDLKVASFNGNRYGEGKTVTVLAEQVGTSTITFHANSGNENPSCKVIVKTDPPQAISISPEQLTLKEKETGRFTYTLIPEDTYSEITWTSSNENVATVSSSGMVTAIHEGTARITATTENGLSATGVVKVNPLPRQISISGEQKVTVGYTIQLLAKILPSNAESKLRWISSDPLVAAVDETGRVRGKKEGTATISVYTENNISASYQVVVGKHSEGMDFRNVKVRQTRIKELIKESLNHVK